VNYLFIERLNIMTGRIKHLIRNATQSQYG